MKKYIIIVIRTIRSEQYTLIIYLNLVSEHKAKFINSSEYQCDLKNNFQIQYEILRGKRLKIATFPVSAHITIKNNSKLYY